MDPLSTDLVWGVIDNAIALERRCIVCAWYHVDAFIEPARRHDLAARRFGDPVAAFLFAFLQTCFEWNVKPHWDLAAAVAQEHGDIGLTGREILDLLVITEYERDAIDDYAAAVALYADRRLKARHLFREYSKLITEDSVQFGQVVDAQDRVAHLRVPKHLQSKARHHAR